MVTLRFKLQLTMRTNCKKSAFKKYPIIFHYKETTLFKKVEQLDDVK